MYRVHYEYNLTVFWILVSTDEYEVEPPRAEFTALTKKLAKEGKPRYKKRPDEIFGVRFAKYCTCTRAHTHSLITNKYSTATLGSS